MVQFIGTITRHNTPRVILQIIGIEGNGNGAMFNQPVLQQCFILAEHGPVANLGTNGVLGGILAFAVVGMVGIGSISCNATLGNNETESIVHQTTILTSHYCFYKIRTATIIACSRVLGITSAITINKFLFGEGHEVGGVNCPGTFNVSLKNVTKLTFSYGCGKGPAAATVYITCHKTLQFNIPP